MQQPTEQMIAERAHELWEEEGRPEGRAEIHWFAAKEELTTRPAKKSGDKAMTA